MEGSVKDLSKYRIEKAREDLETAKENLENGKYRASVNRSYYAVFHALRAVTALDGFDSQKHSGIIAFFNKKYVKTGVFSKDTSKMIESCYRLREKADYDDFYLIAKDEAVKQLNTAEILFKEIEKYLQSI